MRTPLENANWGRIRGVAAGEGGHVKEDHYFMIYDRRYLNCWTIEYGSNLNFISKITLFQLMADISVIFCPEK